MLGKLFVSVSLLTLAASAANARPSYLFVDVRGDANHATFVDVNSIKKHGQQIDYWLLTVNLAPTASQPRYVSHSLKRYTEDCASSTSQMTYSVIYLGSGEAADSAAINAPPTPIIPDSVGAEIDDMLCRGNMPSFNVVETIVDARALGRAQAQKIQPE